MSIFDLIFIGCFLTAIVYSVFIVGLLVRRRWLRVRRHLFQLGTAIGIYFVKGVKPSSVRQRKCFGLRGSCGGA
jgi:hypothetical protein